MTPRPVPWTSRVGPRTVGLVALGGAGGTSARYLLTELLPTPGFPFVTLLINVVGALLLGALVGLLGRLAVTRPVASDGLRLLLGTGLLGGFTTYSALAVDTVAAETVAMSLLYSGATLVLGLAAAGLGLAVTRRRP